VSADDLTLTVDGQALTGWTDVTVTRGIEQMPSSFVIAATEASPVTSRARMIKEGRPCTIKLGRDTVVTGYVDTVVAQIGAAEHAVVITGRGKCQDLVDCAAEWKGGQISGANALEIAKKLAKPYGIEVKALDDPGPAVPQFNINVTDTPASVLELITRHAALLYYEGPNGELILAEASTADAASGFVEAKNVERASVSRSVAQRYSEYVCSLISVATSALENFSDGLFFFTSKDPNVARHRRLVLVADAVFESQHLAEKRANWEASRRAGRGSVAAIVVDSWRDAKGKLWTPNTVAPIELPSLKLTGAKWLISAVTYRRSLQGGTTAEVILMPRESFLPEPVVLQPVLPGLVTAPAS
jgi:prophage tail gpP-like protein